MDACDLSDMNAKVAEDQWDNATERQREVMEMGYWTCPSCGRKHNGNHNDCWWCHPTYLLRAK